jgi:hypothetical protein
MAAAVKSHEKSDKIETNPNKSIRPTIGAQRPRSTRCSRSADPRVHDLMQPFVVGFQPRGTGSLRFCACRGSEEAVAPLSREEGSWRRGWRGHGGSGGRKSWMCSNSTGERS